MTAGPYAESVESVVDRVTAWVEERADIRALALVGSYARGTPDQTSDLDFVILTTRPTDYITTQDWVAELDVGELVQAANWGAITERRLKRPDGLEIEFGIGDPTWASTFPVDSGTRRVVSEGIRILHDPDRLLERLVDACS